MKKRQSAFFLSLCWMISMVAVFSFPPKIPTEGNNKSRQTFLSEVSGPDLHFRSTFENPKTPPFEIDWRLNGKLNSEWIPAIFSPSSTYLAPAFFTKSRALLDIRLFFIRYFYSW
ncbi:hypothetical protein [Algoriphagus aquaeductus]|nr:hypothetical protein [Algoriphagus aquaeductus]